MNINLNFKSSPFVTISSFLSLGIFFGIDLMSLSESLIFVGVSFLFLIVSFYYFSSIRLLSIAIVSLFFFTIGSLSINLIFKSDLQLNFENSYHLGDSYRLKVIEVNNSNKKWNKVISEISWLKSTDSVIQCKESVLLYFDVDSVKVGDVLTLNADLYKIKNKGNPGEFNSEYYYWGKGIDKIGFVSSKGFIRLGNSIPWLIKWSLESRDYLASILQKYLKGQELALAQALILGDRSFLDPETTIDFGNSGAMHVLAVSGLHIGIILEMILFLLQLFSKFLSRHQSLVIALILIWIYTFISGLSPSVLRATFMFSILAISQLNGRNYNTINSLFFTCFLLLLVNPLFLFDIGFQLSFLAMLGIFWFYRPVSNWIFISNKWIRKIWEGTAVGIAAQFVTVPLTLFYFHQFPNYFIFTNIGLMFSTGLILGFGMFIFAFYWLKYLGKIAVFILSIVLFLTLEFVSFIDDLPGSIATGFQLHWLVVFISFLLIISIYLFRNSNGRFLITFYLIGFLLVIFSVINRFNSMNKKEICFYNDSKALFSVKFEDEIFCFYDRKVHELDKVKFTINSYSKIYPGNITYCSLFENDWKIKKKGLIIKVNHLKHGFNVKVNGKNYFLKNRKSTFLIHSKVVSLPWIDPVLNSELTLKNGALHFLISD